ncbi:YagK/YfjJ domain-containing protein [Pseudomonas sp. GM55]|uniref:YagK/YfjJ domain-containing protein n=1 Tax=Pseudomonas sp. GM55 TaxID=1144333 RepID=UPI00068A1AA8|nr:inovirus-type Gp2 protein [Pseudomonas sp. GM55]
MDEDRKLVESYFLIEGYDRTRSGDLVSGVEYDRRVGLALKILPLVREVIASDEGLFSIDSDDDRWDELKSTLLGRRFLRYIRNEYLEIADNAEYCLNPYFEVFSSCVNRYDLLNNIGLIDSVWGGRVKEVVRVLNACVDDIRREVKSVAFKKRLKSYRRSVTENYKELSSYVNDLFDLHARMLVLRVDLSYLKTFRGEGGITFDDAWQHRSSLLKDLNKGGFGHLLGYAWKLEKGERKGLHYHLLLFFDGAQVRQDVVLARMIGEHWNTVVTEGRGSYYNCNASKGNYERCGIGMVSHTNVLAREGIREIVLYMTKLDEYFKLSVPGVRCFGKSMRPKKPSIRRGRPRVVA